jgi:DNA-binding NtrC family response regulator
MTSGRASVQELLRLLAEVGTPLYLLDAEGRIVFLNQATAKWLSVSAEELLGRQCRYQSGDTERLSALADALCPPPEVFHGQKACGMVSKPSEDGRPQRRRANFIPLPGDGDNWVGILVMVQGEAVPADGEKSGDVPVDIEQCSALSAESRNLHEMVRRFRHETAQCHHVERLAGRSSAMVRVREQIKLAAGASGTVLIVGPPGIGRQHVARTIHAAANQRGDANQHGAFVPVSCSVLPPDQVRSTIWGLSERCKTAGSAVLSTLLLLDADRLAAEAQSEIMRWLDGMPENLRAISTATEPLEILARQGGFRADLAQRLSTLVIELPPLADRRDDIPLLAQIFVEDLNAQGGKQLCGFKPEAMDRVALYDWPGQVDELAAIVRQAFAKAEGFEITPGDLPKQLRLAAEAARHPRPVMETIDLEKFLMRVEAELIERAMRQAKGNKSRAARLLGITRPRLYRRMVQLGLEPGEKQ